MTRSVGLLFVVAMTCISTTGSKVTTGRCIIPDEHDLLRLLLENGGVVFTSPQKKETLGVTQEDLHCPVGEKLPQDAPQNARALCPWEMVSDHDATRYPATLFIAVPLCESCLSADGSTMMPGTRCEMVDYPTKILRQKGCGPGGVMRYAVEPFNMPVASRCISDESRAAGI